MDKVRWGIVGPGKIAHQFVNDCRCTSNAMIKAVASSSEERARAFAEKYGIEKYYAAYEDLFNDPEVDAVYVATTHNFHLENSLGAIEAGKAVLCEKPLTDNLADSRTLVEMASQKRVYLMEGMWTYFLPTIKKAREWLAEGRIGKIHNLKANFGYPKAYEPESRMYNPALSGGALLDMGIYPVAMAWLFFNEDPMAINVVAEKAPSGVDRDVNMQLIYADNRVANLHTSFKVKLNNHCYIHGDKGYIDIPDFWRSKDIHLYHEDEMVDNFSDGRQGLGFEFEIEAASQDILLGKTESEVMPLNYSLKLQELMHEIMQKF